MQATPTAHRGICIGAKSQPQALLDQTSQARALLGGQRFGIGKELIVEIQRAHYCIDTRVTGHGLNLRGRSPSIMNTNIQRLRLPENDPTFGSNKAFDLFKYSPAVRAGGLVFIAGQVGIRADGTVPDDVQEQVELAFQRLGAILRLEGLGFDDLVELVSYHVGLNDDRLTVFRAVKDRFIDREFPAWTILGVEALARPALLIEIKAVAASR